MKGHVLRSPTTRLGNKPHQTTHVSLPLGGTRRIVNDGALWTQKKGLNREWTGGDGSVTSDVESKLTLPRLRPATPSTWSYNPSTNHGNRAGFTTFNPLRQPTVRDSRFVLVVTSAALINS